MRVLMFGSAGMLGNDLVSTSPDNVDLVALARSDLDITDEAGVQRCIAQVRPQVIVNAAAYTAVDKAESNRDEALRVNATAVTNIGRIAARFDCRVVHFSSDYVFDGNALDDYIESDKPCPLNVYGTTKLAGEEGLSTVGAEYLIIRTQWLFGIHGRSFPRTMWERARARQATRVINDQWGRPTFVLDLAKAVWRLVALRTTGILHLANTGNTTWYDLARAIFSTEQAEDLLSPCATDEYPAAAQRPRRAVLSTNRAEQLLGKSLPRWEEAVDRFLFAMKQEANADQQRC